MKDQYGREITYLRLSITECCTLHCSYCRPARNLQLTGADGNLMEADGERIGQSRSCELTREEIGRAVTAAAELGIEAVKITGGEPLLRKDCVQLVKLLKGIHGIRQVTLTTNGLLLAERAEALREAGIDGINISLDTMDAEAYRRLTGYPGLGQVLSGLDHCLARSIPVKVNVVATRLLANGGWRPLAELARDQPIAVRFIELMPMGAGKCLEGMPFEELRQELHRELPAAVPVYQKLGNGPAVYEQPRGFQGRIGYIAAIHGKFCDSCNRVRLTSEGYLKNCLCYEEGFDLRPLLAAGTKRELRAQMAEVIWRKPAAHCFEDPSRITEHRGMDSIGG